MGFADLLHAMLPGPSALLDFHVDVTAALGAIHPHAVHSITLSLIGTILVLLGVKEGAGGGDEYVAWVRDEPGLSFRVWGSCFGFRDSDSGLGLRF